MYSDRNEQVIVTSTKHKFRESIFLPETRVFFQPIVGKMERYLPSFSAFKIVSAAQETAEEPEHREQTKESAEASDTHRGNENEGLERRHDSQSSIGAVNGSIQSAR
jgi:hypothetical protein